MRSTAPTTNTKTPTSGVSVSPFKGVGLQADPATLNRSMPNRKEEAVASPILKYFAFSHLPENLQAISRPVGELALAMENQLPDSAEKSAGLRKLLEAKDCFVRALL